MAPRTNFQLARIFGIRIGVGVSWFVVLFFFIYHRHALSSTKCSAARATTAYVVAVASVLSFFASLILHELGHALVARRNGLTVAGIDLWAFGGVTRSARARAPPAMEFRVAAAGPLGDAGGDRRVRRRRQRWRASGKHFFDVAVAHTGVYAPRRRSCG